MVNQNIITVIDLRHIYSSKRKQSSFEALKGISFDVARGEIFGLLGPNGGGKTTLFRILSTMLVPSAGTVTLNGHDVVREPDVVRKKLGVVFQSPSLDKKLTVRENLLHAGHLYGLRGAALEARIKTCLAELHVEDRAKDFVEVLSGGLQRRVEIAKSLLHSPEILLLDEPSSGLDPAARRELWNILKELQKQSVTILLTTHIMDEAEGCSRIAILNHGEIVAAGVPDELKKAIGGDVISAKTSDAAALVTHIREHFHQEAAIIDNVVRLEQKNGHEFIPQLLTSFPGEITSITLAKPSLEEVFVHATGTHFTAEEINN